jgi:hypothetical protein
MTHLRRDILFGHFFLSNLTKEPTACPIVVLLTKQRELRPYSTKLCVAMAADFA